MLFLPEGFAAGEEHLFDGFVRSIIRDVRYSAILNPYELVRDEMNFWSVFIPSRERGLSFRYPVVETRFDMEERDENPKRFTSGHYTISNLLFRVGALGEHDRHFPGGTNQEEQFLLNLQALYGSLVPNSVGPGEGNVERDTLGDFYFKFVTFSYAEELDTAFGIALGFRPILWQAYRRDILHPHRFGAEVLEQLLSGVYADIHAADASTTRIALGNVWRYAATSISTAIASGDTTLTVAAREGARFPDISASDFFFAVLRHNGAREVVRVTARAGDVFTIVRAQQGTTATDFSAGATFELQHTPSFGLIVIICRSTLPCGLTVHASTRYMLFNIDSARHVDFTRGLDPSGNVDPGLEHRVSLARPAVTPRRVSFLLYWTVAHESSHALGLGDEYGIFEGPPPVGKEDYINSYPNIQTRATLLDPEGNISPLNIRWANWVRIAKAGILDAAPQHRGGNNVHLRCKRGTAWQFEVGDIVRLRRRRLIPINPPSRPPTPAERNQNPLMSDRLRIVAKNADELDLLWLGSAPLNFNDFGVDDRLICPVRAPDPSPGVLGDDRYLVAQSIINQIQLTHRELVSYRTGDLNTPLPQLPPASALPATLGRQPRIRANILGLYEAGAEYHRGVFHASGLCLMMPTGRPDGHRIAARFCHVCRYWLVDTLDPTKHRDIECAFAEQYPDPDIAGIFGDICRQRYVVDRARLRNSR